MAYIAGSVVTAKALRTFPHSEVASPRVTFVGQKLAGPSVVAVWHRLARPGIFSTVTAGSSPPPTKGQLWPRIIR